MASHHTPPPKAAAPQKKKQVDKCPDCKGPLEAVGKQHKKDQVTLCHSEKKAFVGHPPTPLTSGATGHPDMYQAIVNNNESTLNIEDIVLSKAALEEYAVADEEATTTQDKA